MNAMYLYGITGGHAPAALGCVGIDGLNPVRAIVNDGLACLVSDYQGEPFGTLSRENLVGTLLAHQRVIERIVGEETVLPIKFGTLLATSREVLDLLAQCYTQFAEALASIQDKVEIEVAATWDVDKVLQSVRSDGAVVRAREALGAEGRSTVENRIRLGQVVKAVLDERRASYRQRMTTLLHHLAVDMRPNPLLSDAIVMNVACLVNRAAQRQFEDRVRELDELFKNEISFRLIGPLPPYSFSTVEILPLTPEHVEEALQVLRLEAMTSEAAVRDTYRRLAAEAQSDGLRDGSPAPAPLARLRQARDLLIRCSRAGGESRVAVRQRPFYSVAIAGSKREEIEPARFGKHEMAGLSR